MSLTFVSLIPRSLRGSTIDLKTSSSVVIEPSSMLLRTLSVNVPPRLHTRSMYMPESWSQTDVTLSATILVPVTNALSTCLLSRFFWLDGKNLRRAKRGANRGLDGRH